MIGQFYLKSCGKTFEITLEKRKKVGNDSLLKDQMRKIGRNGSHADLGWAREFKPGYFIVKWLEI